MSEIPINSDILANEDPKEIVVSCRLSRQEYSDFQLAYNTEEKFKKSGISKDSVALRIIVKEFIKRVMDK